MRPWITLGTVAPEQLLLTRRQLHWAIQPLAQIGVTFQTPRPDNLHYALNWNQEYLSFITRWVEGDKPFRLTLDIPDFTLRLLNREESFARFSLHNQTLKAAQNWLENELSDYLEKPLKLKVNPYQMLEHELQQGGKFHAAEPALNEFQRWYHNAQRILSEIQDYFTTHPPLVCWPRSFELAMQQNYPQLAKKSIRVGFSPGDGNYPEPYFYVTALLDTPGSTLLPELPLGQWGEWHHHQGIGAVLTGSTLITQATQEDAVREFLIAALKASEKLLQEKS